MNRRFFLRSGSVAGITLTTTGLNAFGSTTTNEDTGSTTSLPDNFDLDEITIDELQQKMQSGKITAVALTKMYLDRIASIDRQGQN